MIQLCFVIYFISLVFVSVYFNALSPQEPHSKFPYYKDLKTAVVCNLTLRNSRKRTVLSWTHSKHLFNQCQGNIQSTVKGRSDTTVPCEGQNPRDTSPQPECKGKHPHQCKNSCRWNAISIVLEEKRNNVR